MKKNLIAIMVLAAGGLFAQYGNGDRRGQPGYNDARDDARYDTRYDSDYDSQGYIAHAPPPAPVYGPSFRRPAMPGPGFVWVDGFWSFTRGRYVWVSGYWMRPPYVGSYWVAPRYSSGRFFAGFWGGSRNIHTNRRRSAGRSSVRVGIGFRR